MKTTLISILLVVFLLPISNAQTNLDRRINPVNEEFEIDDGVSDMFKLVSHKIKYKLKGMNPLNESTLLSESFQLCLKGWGRSEDNSELIETEFGDLKGEIDGNHITFTIDWSYMDESTGQILKYKQYYTLNHGIDFIDNISSYRLDSLGNYQLYQQSDFVFENDKPVREVEKGKFSGDDLIVIREHFYNYDGDNVILELIDSYNWSLSKLTRSDSILYEYDGDNLLSKSIHYSKSYSNDMALSGQTVYSYNTSNDAILTEEYVSYDGINLLQTGRSSADYDNEHREIFSLFENLSFGGEWEPSYRDSTYYGSLPLFFYDRNVSQDFEEGQWITSSIMENKDCSGTWIEERRALMFEAMFVGNSIVIEPAFTSHNVTLTLVDNIGRVIYNQSFSSIPNQIDLPNITNGLYYLHIIDSSGENIRKLYKF